jgi:integrase
MGVAALARSYLRSADFASLAPATQRARRYLLEQFTGKYGTFPVDSGDSGFHRRHVKAIMDDYVKRPGVARNVLSMISILMEVAREDGIRDDNPAAGFKRPRLSNTGWHDWTEDEITQYEAKHPIGSQARLAFALALYTSQRSADLIRIGRQHVRDGRISVKQQKTGTSLWIKLHPELKAVMDATPSDHLTLLVTQHDKPYASANSFGHRMRLWAKAAGLTGCPLHGLRKSCLRRLAEAGCTAPEIMAVSGHKSLTEVERYIKGAEQQRMADRAISRTKSYTRAERSYTREKKA